MLQRLFSALALLPISGCLITQTMIDRVIDSDNDGEWEVGYHDGGDCDDDDPAIGTTRVEVCFDGVDNNCDGRVDEDGVNDIPIWPDLDGDGFGDRTSGGITACFVTTGWAPEGSDCDDSRSDILPGAEEACNGRDDDCDELIDEGAPGTTWFLDGDDDGWGRDDSTVVQCQAPPGYVDRGADCDDTLSTTHPAHEDTPYDGVDADCSGTSDFDQDGDGWLDARGASFRADCDDLNAEIHPDAMEVFYDGVDQDCDPATEYDADADGFAAVPSGDDCDDSTPLVRPGLAETWYDGIDQDCDPATEWDQDGDGLGQPGSPHPNPTDCDDTRAAVGGPGIWYGDADGDGFGLSTQWMSACAQPAGWALAPGDCDDRDATARPGGAEVCGGGDEDCDTLVDEGVGELVWRDGDRDGHGEPGTATLVCSPGADWAPNGLDCDDTTAQRSPTATEVCNDVDDDCDGEADEGAGAIWYLDLDLDGHGAVGANPELRCDYEAGWSGIADDCDDDAITIFPGTFDGCNGIDNDCDGTVDEEGFVNVWDDLDSDTYGDPAAPGFACPREGLAQNSADCDDTSAEVRPRATEACDLIDNDCNGTVDDDLRTDLLRDQDGDGYATADAVLQWICRGERGWTLERGDCDDADPRRYEAATETCDDVDEDCDGEVDDGVRADIWVDQDADGWGGGPVIVRGCRFQPGYVEQGEDCDDDDSLVHPGLRDVCNDKDDDCDGLVEEDDGQWTWPDEDGDHHGATGAAGAYACSPFSGRAFDQQDCDDGQVTVYQGATELCDRLDNDCDDGVDEDLRSSRYRDRDRDGVGAGALIADQCNDDSDYADTNGDCEPNDGNVFPGNEDLCDLRDNDCDRLVDEDEGIPSFPDADGDGYGQSNVPVTYACDPTGRSVNNTDCDDGNPTTNPGSAEVCDGVDNNCAAGVDEGLRGQRYADADHDGIGAGAPVDACLANPDYSDVAGDCAPNNGQVYPAPLGYPVHPDLCDGTDSDCDGAIDEDGGSLSYPDGDRDGFGRSGVVATLACSRAGRSLTNTDCDDAAAAVNPDATETCDGIDNNCLSGADEGLRSTRYLDDDGDGFGGAAVANVCNDDASYVDDADDCDDADGFTYPDANERCDGRDNDCDPCTRIDWDTRAPDPIGRQYSSVCDAERFEYLDSIYLIPQDVQPNGARVRLPQTWPQALEWCTDHGYDLWKPDETALLFLLEPDLIAGEGLLPVNASFWTAVTGTCPTTGATLPVGQGFYYDEDDATCETVIPGWLTFWNVDATYNAANRVLVATVRRTGGAYHMEYRYQTPVVSTPFLCELDGQGLFPEDHPECGP